MINILVADDDKNTRLLMKAILEAEHYHVFTAEDGRQALEMLDEVGELLELRRSFFQLRDLRRVDQDFPEGLPRLGRQGSGGFHGLGPDAAGRVVDDSRQAQIVVGRCDNAQVGQHVLDLGSVKEARAAENSIRYAVALERLL